MRIGSDTPLASLPFDHRAIFSKTRFGRADRFETASTRTRTVARLSSVLAAGAEGPV